MDLREVYRWLLGPVTLFDLLLGTVGGAGTPTVAHATLIVLSVINAIGCLITDKHALVLHRVKEPIGEHLSRAAIGYEFV